MNHSGLLVAPVPENVTNRFIKHIYSFSTLQFPAHQCLCYITTPSLISPLVQIAPSQYLLKIENSVSVEMVTAALRD